MKIELQEDDLKNIAAEVFKQLQPHLAEIAGIARQADDDRIMDVDALASYLSVSKKWIYDHVPELPHFKLDGFLRFKKSRIDIYIERQSRKVTANQTKDLTFIN